MVKLAKPHEEKETFAYLLERTVAKCANCGAYKGSREWNEDCPRFPEQGDEGLPPEQILNAYCGGCGKQAFIKVKDYLLGDSGWYADQIADGYLNGLCGGSIYCTP